MPKVAPTNTSIASLRGFCPAPFLDESKFQTTDGFVAGRFCQDVLADLTCCLPCPATDFLYPQSFWTWTRIAEGVNAAGFVLCGLLIVSWLILPVEATRRHYLSVCLAIAIMSMALGFVVPLAVRPTQCYDEITPNDMYSSLTCAWSGAFLVAGGLSVDVWIFIRALSMHLQICWDVVPGRKFFYLAQALGWGVIAALFTATVTFTGFSMRFGDACHVNSVHSMKNFWGPLLGIAAASTLTQLGTFAYCLHVYLKNLWSDEKTDTNSSCGLPSYTSSVRAQSARAVYRRVKKVIVLQWRGIAIVILLLVDVIFFSTVFVYLDNMENAAVKEPEMLQPWLLCLIAFPKEECFHFGQEFLINEATVVAVLMMLSIAGIQAFFLLGRWSMFTAWVVFVRTKFTRKREFVSLDARRFSSDQRAYELLKLGAKPTVVRSPAIDIASPAETYASPLSGTRSGTPDYFAKEVHRHYKSPTMSFSSPTTPNQMAQRMDWDPRSTHARGGLGLHPPASEDDSPMSPKDLHYKL